ncbi:GtrA family protein, partial [Mesorhizobium sp. M8A.F.Ca.ET.161.01.1.1]
MLSIDTLRMEIAHAVGVAVPVFSSYVGHKYLSFR